MAEPKPRVWSSPGLILCGRCETFAVVSAASIALTPASSVASIVATNSGSIRSLGSITSDGVPSGLAAPALAVETRGTDHRMSCWRSYREGP